LKLKSLSKKYLKSQFLLCGSVKKTNRLMLFREVYKLVLGDIVRKSKEAVKA
jgi:hypothetical protein